ncbi:MAG: thermonuclease family protein [Rhizobiaceae bacterium]|nr:thermonuclease family protein [Rhizobiaceae bacterium]
MRFRHAALAASGLMLAAIGIVWTGSIIALPEPAFQADPADLNDAELAAVAEGIPEDEPQPADEQADAGPPTEDTVQQDVPPADEAQPEPDIAAVVAPEQGPAPEPVELERLPPRPPLSGQAAQPEPPKNSGEWKSTRLFKPVASSAGMLEAQGYRIALAGIEPLAPEEKCTFEGEEWPCGQLARTAFRSWLRGRAIACVVPPEPGEQTVVAECHVGKTDVAEWLVSNGWARPASSGPYADAGQKTSAAGKGIYGRPPAQGGLNLPRVADPAPMEIPETGPATDEPLAPPPDQPPLSGPFPPAPQLSQ